MSYLKEQHISAISGLVNRAIKDNVFPGCVIGTVDMSGTRHVLPFGRFTYEQSSAPVVESTIYDLASLTKSIPTALLALQLIEEGMMTLEDRVVDVVTELSMEGRETILVRHLLIYTLGTRYALSALKDGSVEDITQYVLSTNLSSPAGTVFQYANAPALILGLLLERVLGQSIDVAANERFFKPLGMTRTQFLPPISLRGQIVPTENSGERGLVQGEVHDESASVFAHVHRAVGHAGLFSTAPDVLNVLEMLLHDGVYQDKRYFSSDTLRQMHTNQLKDSAHCVGLGWELNQDHFMGTQRHKNTFGKTGFTGTSCVIDIDRGIAFTHLSNRTYPVRPTSSLAINTFRSALADIMFAVVE